MEVKERLVPIENYLISPGTVNVALRDLRALYPRAYDLRSTIRKSVPVVHGERCGILYEVLQDCEDNYPRFMYVLFEGEIFTNIHSSTEKADIVDSRGLFFLRQKGNRTYDKGIWYVDIFEDPKNREYGFARELQSVPEKLSYAFHTLTDLTLSKYGVYVKGINGNTNETTIAYVSLGPDRKWVNIEIPHRFDMETLMPSHKEGHVYLSDETSIYQMRHDGSELMRIVSLPDPSESLKSDYEWATTSLRGRKVNLFEGGLEFILFGKGGLSFNQFISGDRLPAHFERNDSGSQWLEFVDGFVRVENNYNNCSKLSVYYRDAEHNWHNTTLCKIVPADKITLSKGDDDSFIVSREGIHYRLTAEKVKQCF